MNRDFRESVKPQDDFPTKPAIKITQGEKAKNFITFPYYPEFVAKVKTIPGHKYHSDKKYWSFPTPQTQFEDLQRGESIMENRRTVRLSSQIRYKNEHWIRI